MSALRAQLQATLGAAYTLERELGGGGMSRVFVADEVRLGRKVVVKVLAPELLAGVSVERFEREILVAAQLQHPHVVPVLTAGTTDGTPYYTMPYVDGESLRARLARGAPLPVGEAIAILRDVAKALAYAHARGIVHRDIKPDNVLLSGGSATVTDFGIAKALSASRTLAPEVEGLTQAGLAIGTPAYMAPEQAAGDPATDHRADLYAFGCLAYELLAGAPPFAGRTPHQLLAAHMAEAPAPLTAKRPETPPALAALVMRCLGKLPADRPASAAELVQALETTGSGLVGPGLVGSAAAFWQALAVYAVAFVAVAGAAKLAITGIGLPDWVFPGALVVMALGLPAVLWTGYVQRVARRAATATRTPGGTAPGAGPTGTLATLALQAAPKASFSRAGRWGVATVGAFVAGVAAFMGARAYGIGPGKTLLASGALGATDQLVLTDFTTNRADSSLARVVSFAVRTGLGESKLLRVLGQEEVAATLDLMGRPRDAHVDLAVGREIALRAGAKAVIDGNVAAVGSGWVLSVRLVTADSGRELVAVQESGEGPRGLIDAADAVARRLRDRAGESLKDVQNTVAISHARTPSLEALRLFTDGVFATQVYIDNAKAIEKYRAALAIDSNFAEAWRRLGVVLSNSGRSRAAVDSALTRAYLLRDRLSPVERTLMEGSYFQSGPGRDRAKAIAAFRQVPGWENNVGSILLQRREWAAAESVFRVLLAGDTSFTLGQINLVRALNAQGKLRAADSMIRIIARRAPGSGRLADVQLDATYGRGDLARFQSVLDSLASSPVRGDRGSAETARMMLALRQGRVGEWRRLRDERRTLAPESGDGPRPDAPLRQLAQDARIEIGTNGGPVAPTRRLDSLIASGVLGQVPERDRSDLEVATNLALAGLPDRARRVLAEWDRTARDTSLRRIRIAEEQTARGAVALAERRWAEAVALFRKGDSLPDGPAYPCEACLPLALGRAFDVGRQPDSAVVHFERYLAVPAATRRASVFNDPASLAPVHERLGQLYEAQGNVAKALEHDRAFVALWDKADPELQPRVAAARARIARLAPVEPRRP